MPRTRHFGDVLLDWVDHTWTHRRACIHVHRIKGKRAGELYRDMCQEGLEKVGLEVEHLVAVLSDHEGVVRRGLSLLGSNSVGWLSRSSAGCQACTAAPPSCQRCGQELVCVFHFHEYVSSHVQYFELAQR